MASVTIRDIVLADRDRVIQVVTEQWDSEIVVAHGKAYYPADLPGFMALQDDEVVGLLTYWIEGTACEIVTIDAIRPFHGIGTALLQAVKARAIDLGCHRLWLITTNDNLTALRFYQRRGFVLAALYQNALEKSRQLKPQIPLWAENGIPIRDELALEMRLP